MLQKKIEISILYDYYNQLLTDKQRDIVDLYYNQDLSLGEIADEFSISRQAVYDMLKRTEKLLYQYEEKLGFIALLDKKNRIAIDVLNKITELEKDSGSISGKNIEDILNEIKGELEVFLNT